MGQDNLRLLDVHKSKKVPYLKEVSLDYLLEKYKEKKWIDLNKYLVMFKPYYHYRSYHYYRAAKDYRGFIFKRYSDNNQSITGIFGAHGHHTTFTSLVQNYSSDIKCYEMIFH